MKNNTKDMIIEVSCPICGKINEVAVSFDDFIEWQAGALIQNAFPYLSADERELIKTGTCAKCWDKLFGEPEEEEDLDCDCEFVPEDEDDVMVVELGDMTDEDFEAFANFLCG